MSEEVYARVSGAEGEVATVNQPDARDSIPEDAPSMIWCERRYRITDHTPMNLIGTGVQKVCLNPAASLSPALSVLV